MYVAPQAAVAATFIVSQTQRAYSL